MTDSHRVPPPLHLRRVAVEEGWSDGELARLTRSGAWTRVRRGADVVGELPDRATVRHRLLIQATMAGLRRPAVVSHQSAAVLLGLPLWDIRLDRVHITRTPSAWNDAGRSLCCHVNRLRDDDIVLVDGVPVTGPVRTALDLARSVPHEAAVVLLDAALHAELISADALRHGLPDLLGVPGSRAAARGRSCRRPERERRGEPQPGRVEPPRSSPLRSATRGADGRRRSRRPYRLRVARGSSRG